MQSLFFILLVITAGYSYAKDYKVSSPDGKITLTCESRNRSEMVGCLMMVKR